MEESKEIQKLYGFFQTLIYVFVVVEISVFLIGHLDFVPFFIKEVLRKFQQIFIYQEVIFSKLFTFFFIIIVSIGTKAKKDLHLNPTKHILLPIAFGFLFFFGSVFFLIYTDRNVLFSNLTLFDTFYILLSIIGTILIHLGLDNTSKRIKSNLGKDRYNIENESFDQEREIDENPYSVNLPMLFYYKGRVHRGFFNVTNPFRQTLLLGIPNSGKTYGYVIPAIKQHMAKGFSMCIYDYKYPALGRIAYYHYLVNRKRGILKNFKFHVVNLTDVTKSRRVNPLKGEYIKNLPDAVETAEALLQALRKSEKSEGSDQFFTQSAINFLAACIFFLAKYDGGKYSSLPHLLAFINRSYDELFSILYTNPELDSLLNPFRSAYVKKAYDQLEGQLGTLKINISRMSSKEVSWIFSGDDFNIAISNPENPSILVIANDPDTQSINSAVYSLLLNKLIRAVNRRDNYPLHIIADESPTIYLHKIDTLMATAREYKVAVTLGIQEIPQFRKLYARESVDTISSIVGNIISGAARNKETLEWLERIFGKVRQLNEGVNIDRNRVNINLSERLDPLIPAAKIANLQSGELVAKVSKDVARKYTGKYVACNYYCRIRLDDEQIKKESQKYVDLPFYYNFGNEDKKYHFLIKNHIKIKNDIENLVNDFISDNVDGNNLKDSR